MANEKILVVDDDTNICELLRLYLTKEGYQVTTANDAMTPMADINVIEEDIPYVSAHKAELVDKYTEIFTDLQSK